MAIQRGQMGVSPTGVLGNIENLMPPNPFTVVNPMASAAPIGTPVNPTGTLNIRAPQYPPAYADGGMVPQAPQMPSMGQAGVAPPMGQAGVAPQAGPAPQRMTLEQLQTEAQKFAQANPQAVQAIQAALMEGIQTGEVTQQQITMMVQMAVAAAQNPELYPRLRQMAIQQNLADEEDLPMQYDQGIVFALIVAGAAMQQSSPMQAGPSAQQPPAQMRDGGYVPMHASPTGDNTGRRDDVNIRVSGGEYVIPKHVVERKGTEFFDKLLGKDKGMD